MAGERLEWFVAGNFLEAVVLQRVVMEEILGAVLEAIPGGEWLRAGR